MSLSDCACQIISCKFSCIKRSTKPQWFPQSGCTHHAVNVEILPFLECSRAGLVLRSWQKSKGVTSNTDVLLCFHLIFTLGWTCSFLFHPQLEQSFLILYSLSPTWSYYPSPNDSFLLHEDQVAGVVLTSSWDCGKSSTGSSQSVNIWSVLETMLF